MSLWASQSRWGAHDACSCGLAPAQVPVRVSAVDTLASSHPTRTLAHTPRNCTLTQVDYNRFGFFLWCAWGQGAGCASLFEPCNRMDGLS